MFSSLLAMGSLTDGFVAWYPFDGNASDITRNGMAPLFPWKMATYNYGKKPIDGDGPNRESIPTFFVGKISHWFT